MASAIVKDAFGQAPQNTAKAEHDQSMSNPGQQNVPLVKINPSSNMPPPTDHGTLPNIWHSFDLTHRRVQEGGWTHEVTEREVPESKELAGVNMRLTKGSYSELHWHKADEWAIMLKGSARVTLFSPDSSMFVMTLMKETSGCSLPVRRTRFRASAKRAASSCWSSTKALSRRTAPSFFPTG